jgi:hypothetical protein
MDIHKITGQSLAYLKDNISKGLPIFTNPGTHSDCNEPGGVTVRLVEFLDENKINAVVFQNKEEQTIHKYREGTKIYDYNKASHVHIEN